MSNLEKHFSKFRAGIIGIDSTFSAFEIGILLVSTLCFMIGIILAFVGALIRGVFMDVKEGNSN